MTSRMEPGAALAAISNALLVSIRCTQMTPLEDNTISNGLSLNLALHFLYFGLQLYKGLTLNLIGQPANFQGPDIPPVDLYLIPEKSIWEKSRLMNWIFSLIQTGFLLPV